MQKLLVVTGQTATGKTDLAIQLAKKFNAEIVSFDSRQAYKYLDVATGKTSNVKPQTSKIKIKDQIFSVYKTENVPIWLYDIVDPKEYLTAYEFCQKAEVVINNITKRGKLPIIVGGTGFYIKAFLEGLGTMGMAPNWKLRRELEGLSVEVLQRRLSELNRVKFLRMNQSDRRNKRRLIRAIEIAQMQKSNLKMQNGNVYSTYFNLQSIKHPEGVLDIHAHPRGVKVANSLMKGIKCKNLPKFDALILALILAQEKLKRRIAERVQKRLKDGAVEEVRRLLQKGYCFTDPGLNTIGYKQLKLYFEKTVSLDEAVSRWEIAERQYAKRQRVFLKKLRPSFIFAADDQELLAKTEQVVYKWYYGGKN